MGQPNMMRLKNCSTEHTGIALAILAATGFSFKAIFVKLAYESSAVNAVTLLLLRMSFTLPVVLWIAISSGKAASPLSRKDWGLLFALGVLGHYGASILDFFGLQYISAGLERLILFTYPTLTILIGVVWLGKTLERRHLASSLLSYLGIATAFSYDLALANDSGSILLGGAFILGSALSYAFYSAGAELAIARLGSLRFSAAAILVSTLATQLHFCLSQPFSALKQPLIVYLYALGMALFSTVLPVFWQSGAMQRIGAARTVLIGTGGPILTIFFGWWLLGESVSLIQLLGAVLVITGVGLSMLTDRQNGFRQTK